MSGGHNGESQSTSLGKSKKVDDKRKQENKWKFPKSSKKQIEVKAGKYFKGEGTVSSYGSRKIYKRKAGKFLKERKSFLMTQEKQKAVITQKSHLLTKGG